MSNENKTDIDALDAAIASAQGKAKGDEKEADAGAQPAAKASRPKLTEAERAERDAKRKLENEQKKKERALARAAKKAAKLAEKAAHVPHMGKVERAASKLPRLSESAQKILDEVVTNFGRDSINALALHLQHRVRAAATTAALGAKLVEGQSVTIVGGDPRYLGAKGTLAKVQRIRCYVTLEGSDKQVYCFNSDVLPSKQDEESEQDATGTEG